MRYYHGEGRGITLDVHEQRLPWLRSCRIGVGYQGPFRTAQLDSALIQYALDPDGLYIDNLAPLRNLMVTCCDQLPSFDVQAFAAKLRPGFSRVFASYGPEAKDVR
jgi:adenylosuccinate synthase